MNWNLPLFAVTARVFIALATQTFFQPDEYYQSLEVAHHLAFGYGHVTWEWRTAMPIRSIVYPLLNVPVYAGLKVFGLDETRLLTLGPKVLHGLLASLTDIYICKLTARVAGQRYVNLAFWLSMTSLFHGMALSRSLSNSLETSLTTVALSLYPWDVQFPSWRMDLTKALLAAAFACAIRPTNAIIWVYMLATTLWQLRRNPHHVSSFITCTLFVGLAAILGLCAVDTWYYGTLTLTPLNFVTTNLSAVSLFYGSSAWHFYITQGLPILCGTTLPFTIQGLYRNLRPQSRPTVKRMTGLIIWTMLVYSLAGHKEWRFLHPLLPLFHILAAIALMDFQNIFRRDHPSQSTTTQFFPRIRPAYWLVFLLNLPPLLYLILAHSRAQVAVMHFLRSTDPAETRSIGFLMPCHSTPWQAYLHRPSLAEPGRLWALGCEPPVGVNPDGYKDQTDIFYESPVQYLRDRFPASVDLTYPPSPKPFTEPGQMSVERFDWKHEWPQYIVLFGSLLQDREVFSLIHGRGYREVWHEERGWEGDRRRQGGVTVLTIT